MNRALQLAGVLLRVAAAALCIVLGIAAATTAVAVGRLQASASAALDGVRRASGSVADVGEQVRAQIAADGPELAATLGQVKDAAANLRRASAGVNAAVEEVNRPCADGHPCGTLADLNRTLATYRGTAGQIEIALHHENDRIDDLDRQETALAAQTESDLDKLGATIDSANGAAESVTALAANGDLKASLAHLNTTTDAVSAMATDTAQAWHNTLHPKWPRRVWNGIAGVGISVAKFFVP